MKLIKITLSKEDYKNVDTFRNILAYHLNPIQENGLNVSIKEKQDQETMHFLCQFWPMAEQTIETHEKIRESLSKVIASYVIKHKEQEIIREILSQEFGYSQQEEQNQIISFVQLILQDYGYGEKSENSRIQIMEQKIVAKVMEYLWVEHTLTVDGFVRFRLKEQWEDWRQVVEFGLEEYLADKEYREFIQLVRLCLANQETKMKLLHILHIDDRNLLVFNENWQRVSIDVKSLESLGFIENQKITEYEDLFLGNLVYIAPEELIIHTDQENHHIIYTLKRIFEQRVNICTHCHDCNAQFRQRMDVTTS